MANFLYFHPSDNVAPNATLTVQTGVEDTAYPVALAKDFDYKNLANPSMLTGTTGAWQGDFGAAQRMDLVVLWHNFIAGTTVLFQANASASWGGPTISAAFVIPAKRASGHTRKVFLDLRSVAGYSTGGFRYFRIAVTSTNDLPLGLKFLIFSQARVLTRNILLGVEDTDHEIGVDMATDSGHPWAMRLTAGPRSIDTMLVLTDVDAELMREWFLVTGRSALTYFIPNPAVNDFWLMRRSLGGFSIGTPSLVIAGQTIKRIEPNVNAVQLSGDEISSGDPEWT